MANDGQSSLMSPLVIFLFIAVVFDLIGFIMLILEILLTLGIITLVVPVVVDIVLGIIEGIIFSFFVLARRFAAQSSASLFSAVSFGESRKDVRQQAVKSVSKMATQTAKSAVKAGSRITLKFLGAFIAEIIPYLGGLPMWTIFVFDELKQK